MVDALTLGAAWRLAVAIVDRLGVPDAHITSGDGPGELVVRAGTADVATFDLAGEPELRSAGRPPMPVSEWAWPMPPSELRRLAGLVARGLPRVRSSAVTHPRGRVEGQIVVRVLGWLMRTGLELEVVDVRREPGRAPAWLARRADVGPRLRADERWALWALRAGPDVVAVLHDGWLFTPSDETVNLYARYLAGASIHELGEIVLGHKPLPEELRPYVEPDLGDLEERLHAAGYPEQSEEAKRRNREQSRRVWAAHQRRPYEPPKELPQ